MSDLRAPEPSEQALDLTGDTFGNNIFRAHVEVWVYNTLKDETVYSRRLQLKFRADDMRRAHGFVQSISAAISLAHDVWQANLRGIWRDVE